MNELIDNQSIKKQKISDNNNNETDILIIQKKLLYQLNELTNNESCEILSNHLSRCLIEQSSRSFILFDSNQSDKHNIISYAIKRSFSENKSLNNGQLVAFINGYDFDNDDAVIIAIANQMLVRSNRNHLLALDDLTKHFEQCRLNNCPAVIVLYDLHSFASTKKQTLIYTLLDLMHKKELFFIIIGTSSCAFLDSLLEKRIISRLNAQHIFIPTTTTIDIINELSHRLVLSETLEVNDQSYINNHNKITQDLISNKLFIDIITERVEWGYGLSYFIKGLMIAIYQLNHSNKYLSINQIINCLTSLDPPNLMNRLKATSHIQLLVIAVVTRLSIPLFNNQANITLDINKKSNTEKKTSEKTFQYPQIKHILSDFQKLTNTFKICQDSQSSNQGSFQAIISALISLSKRNFLNFLPPLNTRKGYNRQESSLSESLPTQQINELTQVKLLIRPTDIQRVFATRSNDSNSLVVQETIRRIVAQPEVPIMSLLTSTSINENSNNEIKSLI